MAKEISPEQQARIDKGKLVVQELAEDIRRMSDAEKAAAIKVMSLIHDNTNIGYRNVCRPLKDLLKELI